MPTATLLRMCRRPALRAWCTAVLAAMLLVADAFSVMHPLDSAAHANGVHCYVCVSVAGLGHGAVAETPALGIDASHDAVSPLPALVLSISSRPDRPPARGPPFVS